MDVVLLLFLIFLNSLFAMSEMALTASRRARLQVMVESGDSGASHAMALHDNPTKWLSVVQIGITSISVLNGIVGDAAFSAPFGRWLHETFNLRDRVAEVAATAMVVITITFLSIVFGELVPKRLGLMYPETIARLVARPMEWLSVVARPFVRLLSWCTEATLKLMGVRSGPARSVTEEEIAASLEEGLDAGVIEAQEHTMVRNVFRLDDRQVGSMMIPRGEIVWLEATSTGADVLRVVREAEHSRYPVCRGGLDDVLGVISAQKLLEQSIEGHPVAVDQNLTSPVYVPETLSGMELLEHFRASSAQIVFVVDEYGEVQGMITVRDV
ncbi:MAG: hemolysin family protein, partial [Caldimonas sp.]